MIELLQACALISFQPVLRFYTYHQKRDPKEMQKGLRASFRSALTIGAVAAGTMLAGSARADVFTYDTTLASPDTNAATNADNNSTNNASWYDGTDNPQGGWTVDNSSGIEVGLRAKYRQVNSVIDTPNDVYIVAPGLQTQPSPSSDAAWNYEFSIDLRPNGAGALTLADISDFTNLTVTDLTTGATNSVLLSALAGDDTGFGTTNGNTGPNKISESGNPAAFGAGWGAQNSENPTFANWPLAGLQGFNPNAADTYLFQLQVVENNGTVLATDDMEVQVTPEPSAVILLATMILGTFVLARRRQATQS